MAETYRIRVRGHLDATWAAWFDGLTVTNEPGGEALLTGPLADQTALHGVLLRIRDLGLPLLTVNRVPAPVRAARRTRRPSRSAATADPSAEETKQ